MYLFSFINNKDWFLMILDLTGQDDLNVEKLAKNAKLDRYKDRSLINDDSDECSKQHWE